MRWRATEHPLLTCVLINKLIKGGGRGKKKIAKQPLANSSAAMNAEKRTIDTTMKKVMPTAQIIRRHLLQSFLIKQSCVVYSTRYIIYYICQWLPLIGGHRVVAREALGGIVLCGSHRVVGLC